MMKKRNLKSRILALTTCTLVLIGALMLPIGAESATVPADEVPSYTSPVDWSAYPGSNLIPYPYYDFKNTNTHTSYGVTYTLEEYGIVISSGQINDENETSSVFLSLYDLYLEPGTYTLSGSSDQTNVQLIGWVTDETQDKQYTVKGTFTLTVRCQIDIYIAVVPGTPAVNATIMPMLNKGDVACPYQPYLPYYFQQAFNSGYTNGYASGETDGYNKGYEEGWQNLADQAQTDYINAIDLKPYLSANVYGYSNNVYYSQIIRDIPYTVTANKEIEMNQIFDHITTTLQQTDTNRTWAEVVAVEFDFTYPYNNAMPEDKQFFPKALRTGAIVFHSDSTKIDLKITKITGRCKPNPSSSYYNYNIPSPILKQEENNTFYSYIDPTACTEELLSKVEITGIKLQFQKPKSNPSGLCFVQF